MSTSDQNNNRDLLRYAGLATQLFLALGLAVFAGIKLDQWLNLSFPVLVWVLPLLILVSLMYKIIKETNKKK